MCVCLSLCGFPVDVVCLSGKRTLRPDRVHCDSISGGFVADLLDGSVENLLLLVDRLERYLRLDF